MFCYLLYIPYSDFQALNRSPSGCAADSPVSTTNNKELLFNPDCYVGIILDYIYQIVGIPKEDRDNIDLLDRKMNFMNIFLYEPNSEGIDLFNNKMKYYLAYKNDDQIQPLLDAGSDEYQEFFNVLKRRSKKRLSLSAVSKDSRKSSSANKNSLTVVQELSGSVLTRRSMK